MLGRKSMVRSTIIPMLAAVSMLGQVDYSAAAQSNKCKTIRVDGDRKKVVSIEMMGEVEFPTGTIFGGTEVGGLSGITYDSKKNVYYALSDDRSQINPARFYTLSIEMSDGFLNSGDIQFLKVTKLRNQIGKVFANGTVDPEGIALKKNRKLFIASEGDASSGLAPFVSSFTLNGREKYQLEVPDKYLPRPTSGIRNNLAFESLTITPDERYLFTATENGLLQDGPQTDLTSQSLSRILKYDMKTRQVAGEFVYTVDEVPLPPMPVDAFRTNGLVELLALDNNGTLLALERAFSVGQGNTVKLFEVLTQGALDVSGENGLFREEVGLPYEIDPAVQKIELLDFAADLGIIPDNLEGMTLGPELDDGRRVLIIVSDNNFNTTQTTQFIALALRFDTIPAALPKFETPQVINNEEADNQLLGDSDDPAIWLHPRKPRKSLVIATQKDGGLVVFDLGGKVRQQVMPAPFGDIRYNNVDLVYNFSLGGKSVDLAVVSDRENDTLAIFRIDPKTRMLTDLTAATIPETLFGVDDGEATAYGLCTYTSPKTGKQYVFVTQSDGNLVAQLELFDSGKGTVDARVVRILELPVPTGDPGDSQAEGIVADRQLGVLYVAMEEEVGILKTSAEPEDDVTFELVHSIDEEFLQTDLEGLTIYYGPGDTGYILVSSQGDSSYAILERDGDNEYLGSMVIGDNRGIDQANESDGADVLNAYLGPQFPYGLLVVQDGANDPQNVVEDEEELENNSTNFKFVPWQNVASGFKEPLLVDQFSYNPRNPVVGTDCPWRAKLSSKN